LLKHVGANLECINKSYYYLDEFVGFLQRYYKMLGPAIKKS
jgi:hypothetical protein